MTTAKIAPMETIISVDIEREHYTAEAVNCFCTDCRLAELYISFFKVMGYENPDRIFVPGGAKKLASPVSEGERQSTLGDILDLLELHHCQCVNLSVHAGCGKYGKKFQTEDEETIFYQVELFKAREVLQDFLKANDYKAEVHLYLGDWKGLHEVKGPAL